MEIRKNIKNHFFLFYLLTVAICFVLGYVLLVSLDKISNPTISELYVSIYTVITQFGMLIFPVLIIQSFVSDYKNKNILFYKLMGYNWLRYFLTKIAVILAWMSIIVFGGVIGISIVYQDFSYTLATLFYFESAIIYEILLASMWGFLFKSVIGAYVVNFAFWLFSMVASIANPSLLTETPIQQYGMNGCCVPGQRRIYVTTKGEFLHCEKVGNIPCLGNVNEGFDKEKIKKLYVEDFIEEAKEYCKECWAVNLCTLCYVNCYDANGLHLSYRHNSCRNERKYLEDNLRRYHALMEANPSELEQYNEMEIH